MLILKTDEEYLKRLEKTYRYMMPILDVQKVGSINCVLVKALDFVRLLCIAKLWVQDYCSKCGGTDYVMNGKDRKGRQVFRCNNKDCRHKWPLVELEQALKGKKFDV